MGANTNPFDIPSPTVHWGTSTVTSNPSAKDKVEQALTETIDKLMFKLPYATGEEVRNWADAIQSLCAGLANLDVIEDA